MIIKCKPCPGQGNTPSLCQCLVTCKFHFPSCSIFSDIWLYILSMFVQVLYQSVSKHDCIILPYFIVLIRSSFSVSALLSSPFYVGRSLPTLDLTCRGRPCLRTAMPFRPFANFTGNLKMRRAAPRKETTSSNPPGIVGQWTNITAKDIYTNHANHCEKSWSLSQPTFRTCWNLTKS